MRIGKKRILSLFLALCLMAALIPTAVLADSYYDASNPPKSMQIVYEYNSSDLVAFVGETYYLDTEFYPTGTWDPDVTMTSSDESVVKVGGGVITCLKAGKATVTATGENCGLKDTMTITVLDTSIMEKLTLGDEKKITIPFGEALYYYFTYTGNNPEFCDLPKITVGADTLDISVEILSSSMKIENNDSLIYGVGDMNLDYNNFKTEWDYMWEWWGDYTISFVVVVKGSGLAKDPFADQTGTLFAKETGEMTDFTFVDAPKYGVVGEDTTLHVIPTPAWAAIEGFTFESSDESIVDAHGTWNKDHTYLDFVGEGTATITATSESGIKKSIEITVLPEGTDFDDYLGNTDQDGDTSGTPDQGTTDTPDQGTTDTPDQGDTGTPDTNPDQGTTDAPDVKFTDLVESKFYYDAVLWAVDEGVTNGYTDGTFRPDAECTRGQVVTFLWRFCGEPEPESSENPFTDLDESKFYYKAVLWAVEMGITTGKTDTTFQPNATCTRSQVVTFLWRLVGEPAPESSENPFTDVGSSAYYKDAVLWAGEMGITKGKTATTFLPKDDCTRGHIVTFLYRFVFGE